MNKLKNSIKLFIKYLVLWLIGGSVYYGLECLWRTDHHSHWSMFILGGVCFIILGLINELLIWETPFYQQCLMGAIIITTLELITGCIVNIWLGWNVWHYEHFDILGQICLPFSLIWIVLSGVAIVVDDWLRYWWFGEEKPHYKWM